ncbi:MAG: DUF2970 domain-containing protein [Gammaproteobacteria bacterium]|nr:DUF2970 domain-containing protein [Gammaproteobacteria bacterium]
MRRHNVKREPSTMSGKTGDTTEQDQSPLSLWQVTKSVMWAFLGIQKDATRERDLSRGKPIHFIIIGLTATILFIAVVVGVVSLVMSLAQP